MSAPKSDNASPVGTWVLLCLVAAAMALGWLFLYFGVFIPGGPIH